MADVGRCTLGHRRTFLLLMGQGLAREISQASRPEAEAVLVAFQDYTLVLGRRLGGRNDTWERSSVILWHSCHLVGRTEPAMALDRFGRACSCLQVVPDMAQCHVIHGQVGFLEQRYCWL